MMSYNHIRTSKILDRLKIPKNALKQPHKKIQNKDVNKGDKTNA